MTLLEQIRQDQIAARKARLTVKTAVLTTLLSEASNVGLNDGKRDSTDAEVIAVAKKFIKGIDESLDVVQDEDRRLDLEFERTVISEYLPAQLDEAALRTIVRDIVEDLGGNPSPKMMGMVMKTLKDVYAGQYDGKLASNVARSVLTGG